MVRENIIESYMPEDEMTRFGFISHMEDFIKKLLQDPKTAKVDDYLQSHGIDSPKALTLLLKKSDPSDETSAILIRTERIKPEELSEEDIANGKQPKDKFHIKYKLPRKDYMKKMRNLYISLFENHITDNNKLNEENANDLPSDVKMEKSDDKINFSFGKNGHGLSDELTKIGKEIEKLSKDNNVYIDNAEIDSLDDVYDLTVSIHPIKEEISVSINEDLNYYERPLSSTPNVFKNAPKVISQCPKGTTGDRWAQYVNDNENNYVPKMIDEDGEGGDMGGATTCDASSGQFIQPLTKKPIRRTIYLTKEQYEYLKEAVEMDTAFGDFGHDAPGLEKKKNDPAYDHKNMMKKSWRG